MSHLSQIWTQTMTYHLNVKNIFCYSGGTEAAAMFPKVGETLIKQWFEVIKLLESSNSVDVVRNAQNEQPAMCFFKEYSYAFNPSRDYAAIVTCNSADEACPIVFGAEARFPVKYDDHKAFDGTDEMDAKYAVRSLQIGEEIWYVFSQLVFNSQMIYNTPYRGINVGGCMD